MEIDRRHVERLIRKNQVRERTLDGLVRRQPWLDPVAEVVQKAVGGFYGALGAPGRTLKDALHGTTVLGHSLHAALTDVPIGAWTVGVVADWIFVLTGRLPAAAGDVALGIGVAGALASAASGLTDFHETNGHERRTAIVHGLTMLSVVVIESVSLGLRVWGPAGMHLAAVVLASAGYLLALAGAYVGGHLTFGIGTAINHNAFFEGPADFVRVGTREDFPEGAMKRVDAGGLPVLILRRNGLLRAMGAVCSHAGGPLEEGKLLEGGEVVECPWHHSCFRFDDGRVVGGPATFDQPPLIVRERGGVVEVKLAHPLH